MYLRSAFLTMLRSRWAPVCNFLLAGAVVLVAAAPDFGLRWVTGWQAFTALALLFLLSQLFGVLVHGSATQSYIDTFSELGYVISSLADGARDLGGGPQILVAPTQAIEALLRRAREFVGDTLKLPVGSQLSATLLLPVVQNDEVVGLQANYRAELRWNSVRRIVPLSAPGAGQAFTTGHAQGVPDIEQWEPTLDNRPRRYRSIAAFPVLAGEKDQCPVVLAVISLDCAVPMVFTTKRVQRELAPFIQPIAQLIGLALRLHEEEKKKSSSPAVTLQMLATDTHNPLVTPGSQAEA